MLEWLLEREAYAVTVAHSYQEALLVIDEPWDLVITDLGLPDGSGVDLGKRLMRHARKPRMIAMTGWGMPRDRDATRAAGFDEHLVKPLDVNALLRLLKK